MLTITDIFGNKLINNNTPFLILFSNNWDKYLILKDSYKDDLQPNPVKSYIYKINDDELAKEFKNNGIDIKNFLSSSDLLIFNDESVKQVLYINRSISEIPLDFISLQIYNNGIIWEPIGNPGYKSIGLIYNRGNKKPKCYDIPLVPVELLVKIKNGPLTGFQSYSEFKNLSTDIHGFYTIDKNRISSNNSDYFKLLSFDGKYLTKVEDNFALVNNKNKNRHPEQIIQYTINGDIVVKNKCLSVDDNDNIFFEDCNNSLNNKWSVLNNNIISKKNNKCITADNNNDSLIIKDCNDSNIDQQFTKELPAYQSTVRDDFKWKNIKGKSVVLSHNDNPWYLNKDIAISYDNSTNSSFDNAINDLFVKDKTKPSLTNAYWSDYPALVHNDKINYNKLHDGVGNTYFTDNLEGFGQIDNDYSKMLTVLIIILAIFLIVYLYKNKSNYFKS